jgi:transposase
MNYIGIDIGKEKHAVSGIDDTGRSVGGAQFFAADAGGYASLTGLLRKLGPSTEVLIGMEATGHYGKLLAHRLREDNWTVRVFNPAVIAAAAKGDLRGRKTDKLDAQVIAQALRDGRRSATQIASADEEQLKMLGRQRAFLVRQRTECKNHLTALLDVLFPELAGFFKPNFSPSFLALVARFPSAVAVTAADLRTLTSLLRTASRGQLGRDDARALQQTARTSLARTRTNAGEAFAAQQTAQMIQTFNEQIERLEEQMQTCNSMIATYLASIKGFGKVLPFVIAGEIGNLERFQGPNMTNRVLAFAGCEPRIRESGKWKGHTKMSRRGSTTLRCALYLAANTVRLNTPAFAEIYQRHIARGKPHAVALSHVMRAIINTLCGMHKTSTLYRAPEYRKAG